MKRLVVVIIGAVIAGKLFAAAVMKFAENSDLTSKTLVHRLLLDKLSSDDQMNIKNIPNNLAIAKAVGRAKARPRIAFTPQNFPVVAMPVVKPLVVAKKIPSTDEKAIEDKAKEDERRKKRLKTLEEKSDPVANKSLTTPPVPLYFSPVPTNDAAAVPTYYGYQAPPPQPSPQTNAVAAPVTPAVSTGSGTAAKTNLNSWTTLLVSNPTSSLMSAFEGMYKANQISESSFYSVLDAMKASSNVEARNFSVQGAALYQNIYSFKILADEGLTESNGQIKSLAMSAITVYATPADASILQQALASGDPYEVSEAKSLMGSTSVATTAATTGQPTGAMAYQSQVFRTKD